MRFRGQYLLHRCTLEVPDGWRSRSVGDWTLSSSESLPVADLLGVDGVPHGWLIGYVVSPDGEFLPKQLELPQGTGSGDADAFESLLYRCSGRFAAVLLAPEQKRAYLDAGGSLSLVYARERPICAATPLLVPGATPDTALTGALGMPESGLWYPSGLTPYRDVRRLLPSHYLDLETWQPVRHWPRNGLRIEATPSELVSELVERTRRTITAVAKAGPAYLNLTAGRDTRMLLACARPVIKDLTMLSLARNARDLDAQVATILSRRLDLTHLILGFRPPTEEDLRLFSESVGHCVAGEVRYYHRSSTQVDSRATLLGGLGGEVGRCFYWQRDDSEATRVTAEMWLERARLPAEDSILKETRAWLDGLPAGLSAFDVLDLAYIEQRLGCWAGPQAWGLDGYVRGQLLPLCDRRSFECMLSLPAVYRRRQQLALDVVRTWPALETLPFNEPLGWRRYSGRAWRALRPLRLRAKRWLRTRGEVAQSASTSAEDR